MRLSLALAAPLTAGALLLTSCSAASAPAPTAAGSTAPSTAAAPKGEVAGAEVDKAAFIAQLKRVGDQDYFERGLELAITENALRIAPLDISDLYAVEVDFAEDLERANLFV